MLYLILFIATIPGANWLIGNVGTVCVPNGPCLIPVWPGVMSPSGVLLIGAALVLRDLVQDRLGKRAVLIAIGAGAALSFLIAPAALAAASAAAFLLSELADFAVYTPLRRRGLVLAVVASSLVGLCVDSVLFLQLAFGSLDHLTGQIIGKVWAVAAGAGILAALRRQRVA